MVDFDTNLYVEPNFDYTQIISSRFHKFSQQKIFSTTPFNFQIIVTG